MKIRGVTSLFLFIYAIYRRACSAQVNLRGTFDHVSLSVNWHQLRNAMPLAAPTVSEKAQLIVQYRLSLPKPSLQGPSLSPLPLSHLRLAFTCVTCVLQSHYKGVCSGSGVTFGLCQNDSLSCSIACISSIRKTCNNNSTAIMYCFCQETKLIFQASETH